MSRQRAHPALVTEEDFVRVQAINAVELPGDGSRRRYVLVGLVLCGVCGRRMESCWVHGRPGYRCRHGHCSGKPASGERTRNLYWREDRIFDQIAAAVEELAGHRTAAGSGTGAVRMEVAGAIRSQRMMITCTPEACVLTGGATS